MNKGARDANQWDWQRDTLRELRRIAAALEALVEVSASEEPSAAPSPSGPFLEGSEQHSE